jgi:hypothetical protein
MRDCASGSRMTKLSLFVPEQVESLSMTKLSEATVRKQSDEIMIRFDLIAS